MLHSLLQAPFSGWFLDVREQRPSRRVTSMFSGLVGSRMSQWSRYIPQIAALEEPLKAQIDFDLKKTSLSLRYRARSGEPLDRLLVEAFALVREAGRRRLNMRHFDVQLLGGAAVHHNSIVEMQTGEGKTLTATLPLYLAALEGKGAHLATVNDYLAKRDADWMRPLYEALGMKVGCIQSSDAAGRPREAIRLRHHLRHGQRNGLRLPSRSFAQAANQRRAARLVRRHARQRWPRQRDASAGRTAFHAGRRSRQHPHRRSPDAADHSARCRAKTKSSRPKRTAGRRKMAEEFHEDEHYDYDHKEKTVELTLPGGARSASLHKPEALDRMPLSTIYEHIERAVKVAREMILDRQYVVRDGEIVIVDEFTGRLGEGRKWRAGIHQAVEAKEGVEITFATNQAARITVQDFFLRYDRLAGMTGTASTSAGELHKIYGTTSAHRPDQPATDSPETDDARVRHCGR